MLDFLRAYRGIYLLATVFALAIQIPLTLPEAFRMEAWRYCREILEGVKGAFRCAWGC